MRFGRKTQIQSISLIQNSDNTFNNNMINQESRKEDDDDDEGNRRKSLEREQSMIEREKGRQRNQWKIKKESKLENKRKMKK